MRHLLLLFSVLIFPNLSNGCCCTYTHCGTFWCMDPGCRCGCNMFNCNCDTFDGGWCGEIAKKSAVDYQCQWINYGGIIGSNDACNVHHCCASSKNRKSKDYCPDRRRKKRSIPAALIKAYGGLYIRRSHFYIFLSKQKGWAVFLLGIVSWWWDNF